MTRAGTFYPHPNSKTSAQKNRQIDLHLLSSDLVVIKLLSKACYVGGIDAIDQRNHKCVLYSGDPNKIEVFVSQFFPARESTTYEPAICNF